MPRKASSKEGLKQVTISKFFAPKNRRDSDDFDTDEVPAPVKKPKLNEGAKRQSKSQPKESSPSKRKKQSSKTTASNDDINHNNHDGEEEEDNKVDDPSTSPATSSTAASGQVSEKTKGKLGRFSLDAEPESGSEGSTSRARKPGRKLPDIDSDHEDGAIAVSDEEQNDMDSSPPGTSKGASAGLSGAWASKFTSLKKSSSGPINKQTKTKYTPLEQQYMEIKEKYSDAILMVECGYKYRFFGEDAEVAAKVLKIYCHMDHNFMTASIPTHRLFVHVRRLVASGYKVGVVKQTETAALKAAGDNRSAPFSRQLSALYTKSTLIGEDVDPLSGVEVGEGEGETTSACLPNAYLMCVMDGEQDKVTKQQTVGVLAVDPSTGDMVYDCFPDRDSRAALETRITHIQPVELLMPADISAHTARLVKDIAALSSTEDDRIRVEILPSTADTYPPYFEVVSDFYTKLGPQTLQRMVNLPRPVIGCLGALINYLKDFNLQGVLKLTGNLREFSTKARYMQLSAGAMRNLELFHNSIDGSRRGSLLSLLDQTSTRFGSRQLSQWLASPLISFSEIQQRHEAVEELVQNRHPELQKLQSVLSKVPDMEKGLISIFHKKCSTAEFYLVAKALERVYEETKQFCAVHASEIQSSLLQDTLASIPDLLEGVKTFSTALYEKAAKENSKTTMFKEESQFPVLVARKASIQEVLEQLREHRREIRLTLKQPSLDYVTVMQTEFLVEVRNTQLNLVPSDWTKINSTKVVSRFHTPFVVESYRKLGQLREQLTLDASQAWMEFLQGFSEHYQQYKKAVQHLATLDCLLALAKVSKEGGYTRPEMVEDENCIEVEEGRHPVIEALLAGQHQYVPNSTSLSTSGRRVAIITGPNMGGKSSYIRQVALIAIMAQVGCFVPAQQARLGILDAIHTRMGAADEIFKGRSTFMVELAEAGEILGRAGPRSLVILDELGRGTSTHDGVAIAHATLLHLIQQVKCLTLFVTHYPILAELQHSFPDSVANFHMSFFMQEDREDEGEADPERITFLYQLVEGSAAKSYGLNVARLADIPASILRLATQKSHELEKSINARRRTREAFCRIFHSQSADEVLAACSTVPAEEKDEDAAEARSSTETEHEAMETGS